MMEHSAKVGSAKIVTECTLPLTSQGCVRKIVTDLAVIDVVRDGLLLRAIVAGHSAAEARAGTEPDSPRPPSCTRRRQE